MPAERTTPKERPLPFQPSMVRATITDEKTQTRRRLNPLAQHWLDKHGPDFLREPANKLSRLGYPGDRLWVREAFRAPREFDPLPPSLIPVGTELLFEADLERGTVPPASWGRPRLGRFMCRWMSRTLLEITDLRVERVQELTNDDARAEGVLSWVADLAVDPKVTQADVELMATRYGMGSLRCGYAALWDSINGFGDWQENPAVWVIAYRRMAAVTASRPDLIAGSWCPQ
jgi:hypothetical protein